MLNEVIRATISVEPDMAFVASSSSSDNTELGAYTRRRHIDVVIFVAGDENFADDKILSVLRINPRLRLIAIGGKRDQGTLHHLVASRDEIGRLAQSNLTAAIRTGATWRLD